MRPSCVFVLGLGIWCGCEGESISKGTASSDAVPGGASVVPECATDLRIEEAAVRRVARLGAVEGDESALFGAIQDVGVLSTGGFAVLDPVANHVVLISDTGAVKDTLGRAGGGPGEFEGAWKLHAQPEGGVTVLDATLWRATTFRDGRVQTRRLIPDVAMGQFPDVSFTDSGEMYRLGFESFSAALEKNMRSASGSVVRGENIIQRWDEGGGQWVNVLRVPGREVLFARTGGLRDPPYAVAPVWTAAAEDGFWYGDGGGAEIGRYSRVGELLCSIRVPVTAVPISDSERAEYYEPTSTALSAERRRDLRDRRRGIPMPEQKPVMLFAFGAGDDRIWVNVSRPESVTGSVWMDVDLGRRTATRVLVPPEFFPMRADGPRLVGVYRDSLQVPYVGVYEVVRERN